MASTAYRLTGIALAILVGAFLVDDSVGVTAAEGQSFRLVGQAGGEAHDVAARANHVYVGVDRRLAVVDFSETSQPTMVGITDHFSDPIVRVAVMGQYGYVSYGGELPSPRGGLGIVDVSDPRHPTRVSQVDVGSPATSIVAVDGHIYLTVGGAGTWIIDVSDPASPFVASVIDPQTGGPLNIPAIAVSVDVQGQYALVLERATQFTQNLLRVIDASNAQNPIQVGSYLTSGAPRVVAVDGGVAYVVDSEGFSAVSLADPARPVRLGVLGAPVAGDPITDIGKAGDRVYLIGSSSRIIVIDVQDPHNPHLVGVTDTMGLPKGLVAQADRIIVANGDANGDGLREIHAVEAFETRDGSLPHKIGLWNRESWLALGVAIENDIAYVAAGGSGLRIADISDPGTPHILGLLDCGGQVTDVNVRDVYAFVADGSPGPIMRVVDVSDPSHPRLSGALDEITGEAVGIEIVGSYAFVALRTGDVVSVDISTPEAPRLEGRTQTSDHVTDLDAANSHLYVRAEGGGESRLHVVNADDPTSLAEEGSFRREMPVAGAPGLAFEDRYTFLPGLLELDVVDVDDPSRPISVGRGQMSVVGFGVAAEGGRVYVSGDVGFAVIDATDPAAPEEVAYLDWPMSIISNRSNGGEVVDGCFYAAHYTAGLVIVCFDPSELPTPTSTPTQAPSITPTVASPASATATRTTTQSTTPTQTLLDTATWTPSATTTHPPTSVPTTSPSPSVTATETPTTTPSFAASATPCPTTTAGRLETVTPTRHSSRTAFLPIGLTESCPPRDVYADVALVIDASTSMLEATADRRRKIDVAADAARAFLDGLRLFPGQDRAAIVAFNDKADILQPLTDDPSLLTVALIRIRIGQYTRVDLGIERATVELVARSRPGHVQAMVVLSDGVANPVSADTVIEAAQRAQVAGITVYVVGMGPSTDERVLRAMASGPARFFSAPDPTMIRAIYVDLTKTVPCPPDRYWGRR